MANRKEYELMFKLNSQVSGSFSGSMKKANAELVSMQKEISSLNHIRSDITAYQKQQQAVEKTEKKLESLQKQYDNIQKEIQETGKFSSDLENKLVDKQHQIDKTRESLEQQTGKLDQMGTSLREAGVDTGKLTEEEKRLKEETQQLRERQKEAAESAEGFGDKAAEAMDAISAAIAAAGIAAALNQIKDAFMECIDVAGSYEETLSTVEALSGASENEMAELSGMAKQLGAETQYTAQESADAMTYMAMAGWETEDMLNGMDGVLQLAAASGEDLALVSDIVTDNLTAFGLAASDTAHFSDVLASAATSSNTSVSIMGETFKQSASIAGALGYSVDDVAVAVGLMANSGIKGSMAGTALKNTFNGLLEGVELTGAALGEYEFSAQKSDGTMKNFAETINELRSVFGQMTEAEKTSNAMAIAGNRSYNGLLAIVNAADEDFDSLSDSIKNCNGAASKMASIKMDNMKGDLKLAQSAWEGVTIAVGEQFTPVMRKAYQAAAEVFSWMKDFVEEHPAVVKAVTAFVAVIGTATAAMTAYAAVKKVVKALDMATLFTGPAGTAMLAVGSIAALVAGIVAVAESSESAVPSVKELTEETRKMNDIMEEAEADYNQTTTEMMAQASAAEFYIDKLEEIDYFTHGHVKGSKEYHNILQLLIRTMPELADSIDLETNSIEGGTDALRQHMEAWKQDAETQARQEYVNSLYDEQNAILKEQAENEIKLTEAKLKEEKATEKLKEAQQRRKSLLKEYGASGELPDEYYDLGDSLLTYQKEIDEAVSTQENLSKAIEENKSAVDEAETTINEAEEAIEEMTAAEREAAGEAAELSEQNAMVSETVGDISVRAEELAERYEQAYGAARESISGQYALWDETAKVAEKSTGDMASSIEAQAQYWQDYNANLSSLAERAGDVEGLREVIASFADGSEESVNAIAGMANASDSDLQAMADNWKKLQEAQETASGSIADLKEDFTNEMAMLGDELAANIEGMNLSDEAAAAAQETIQGFIDGASGMLGQVQSAYAEVAKAAKNALNGTPSGSGAHPKTGGNAPAGRAYASGTSSAERGFALVGEEGPEIVFMNGGETVLNATETAKAQKELSIGNLQMRAAQAQPEAYEAQPRQNAAVPSGAAESDARGGVTVNVYSSPTIVAEGGNAQGLEETQEEYIQILIERIKEALNSGTEGRTQYA